MAGTVECMFQALLCEFGYLGTDTVWGYNIVEVSLAYITIIIFFGTCWELRRFLFSFFIFKYILIRIFIHSDIGDRSFRTKLRQYPVGYYLSVDYHLVTTDAIEVQQRASHRLSRLKKASSIPRKTIVHSFCLSVFSIWPCNAVSTYGYIN